MPKYLCYFAHTQHKYSARPAGKKLVQGIVDPFRPIRDLDLHAYTLTRLAKGATGTFEALLKYGKLSLVDGVGAHLGAYL